MVEEALHRGGVQEVVVLGVEFKVIRVEMDNKRRRIANILP